MVQASIVPRGYLRSIASRAHQITVTFRITGPIATLNTGYVAVAACTGRSALWVWLSNG